MFSNGPGTGVWNTEAEYVADFNATMRDSGIKANYTSAADIRERASRPVRTVIGGNAELPRGNGGGNQMIEINSGATDGVNVKDTAATPRKAQSFEREATPGQTEWLIKMHLKKIERADVDDITTRAVAGDFVSFAEAKTALDYLFNRSIGYRKVAPVAATRQADLAEGMWIEVDGSRIFKLIEGDNGLYACELIDESFDYARGLINRLPRVRRMTLAEAKNFGKQTGTCCVCARTLRNPKSIEAGIGPVCASKF